MRPNGYHDPIRLAKFIRTAGASILVGTITVFSWLMFIRYDEIISCMLLIFNAI